MISDPWYKTVNKASAQHLPPADLDSRSLPLEKISRGRVYRRLHPYARNAIHYNGSNDYRFNAPNKQFTVLYVAEELKGAFAETLLRDPGKTLIDQMDIDATAVSEIEITRQLSLVKLHGDGLVRAGATAIVSSGKYAISQAWSLALWQHRQRPDGIIYRANHDNGQICLALFGHTRKHVRVVKTVPLGSEPFLAQLLDHYGVGIG